MGYYFDDRDSAAWILGKRPEKIIRLMAARYLGDNPEMPFVWRTWNQTGIQSSRKGTYEFDFGARFPEGTNGEIAYALGDMFCPEPRKSRFLITCRGPVSLRLNGEGVFVSGGDQEGNGRPVKVDVSLKRGYNRFLIRCVRTASGFGCSLQNAMPQWEPCNYLLPFEERKGAAGFLYTEPMVSDSLNQTACWRSSEKETGIRWLPDEEEKIREPGYFYAWTRYAAEKDAELRTGITEVFVDGRPPEPFAFLPRGIHSLLLYGTLEILRETIAGLDADCRFFSPVRVHGVEAQYLLLGPCERSASPAELTRPGAVYGNTIWRPDRENTLLRPYAEAPLFGRWTYPLGVTLYGLLSAGRLMGEPFFCRYVQSHVSQVTGIHDYAIWDTEHFGFAGVNQQLCWLDALDDCGSFGSLILECDGGKSKDVQKIARRIAEYMLKEQPRTEDGAFCRRDGTIWADDMYMSGPFLCRYSAMTGDSAGIGTCAQQLLKYRDLLFMPQKKLMAHMICLRQGKNNQIPWSRGNGWVIFTLSELFLKLPENHPDREALLAFYRDLTEGYLAVQGKEGLWHQVLDDETTYPEASSTAMMICAFCRGLRLRLYPEAWRKRIAASAEKAWKGLAETAVDCRGNLYGVCRGSGFSYSRDYYRSLSWRFNDTHGIGIVMLAGTEILQTADIAVADE